MFLYSVIYFLLFLAYFHMDELFVDFNDNLLKEDILQQITLPHVLLLLKVPAFVQNVSVIEVLQCLKHLKFVVEF